jgi:hypothetical protein
MTSYFDKLLNLSIKKIDGIKFLTIVELAIDELNLDPSNWQIVERTSRNQSDEQVEQKRKIRKTQFPSKTYSVTLIKKINNNFISLARKTFPSNEEIIENIPQIALNGNLTGTTVKVTGKP